MSASTIINEEVERGFYVSPTGITITGRTRQYDTYEQMLKDPNPSKFAWVLDATGDPTVKTGAAFYVHRNNKWQKLYESEAMDNENFGKPEGYDELVVSVDGLKERVEQLADSTVLNEHINNSNIHITVDDRNTVQNIANLVHNKVDKIEYTSKIDTIESDISRLDQTKMNSEDGLDLHNRIGLAEQNIQSIDQRQDATESTVGSVVTTVAETKVKVDNIAEDIAMLKATKQQLAQELTRIETEQTQNLNQVSSATTAQFESHLERIVALEQTLYGVEETISEIEEMIE